jgi:hypothetical protein
MERDFVAKNRAATERLRALTNRMSDDDLQRTLDNGWSVAVGLAHLAFFDRRFALLVDRFDGDQYGVSIEEINLINDAMLPLWQLIPPRAAANEALAAAAAADEAAENLSNERLATIQESAAGTIRVDRARHRNNHSEEIEALFA